MVVSILPFLESELVRTTTDISTDLIAKLFYRNDLDIGFLRLFHSFAKG